MTSSMIITIFFFYLIHPFNLNTERSITDTVLCRKSLIIITKPKCFSSFTNIPSDMVMFSKDIIKKKNIPILSVIAVSTGALIFFDQNIVDASQQLGKQLKIDPNSSQKPYFGKTVRFFSQSAFLGLEGPHDISSVMYFLGDGWEHLAITSGFYLHGIITKNNKSRQIAASLSESILTSGIIVQIIKHITGRQSPFTSTAPGGVWRFFPNQMEYHKHVSSYDAFPSGHIATLTATVTVLSSFYPKSKLIKPIGYSLMSILMFAMLNNGVHWASDYPLGIALGYSFAKIAVKNQRKLKHQCIN